MVVRTLTAQLESQGLGAEHVRRMWLHQANINMNEWIVHALLARPLREDDAPIVLREYANTGSAGSIVAFHKHRQGLSEGDHGILCSFGAGYSIGSILLRKR